MSNSRTPVTNTNIFGVTGANGNHQKIAASIEVTPRHALEIENLKAVIPAGTRAYITDLGSHDAADMARACARLRDNDIIAVPHIAARRLINQADLEERVKHYAGAGVSDVLVIGGSPEHQAGDIDSTMEILATGILDANGITKIGVAGHPEGSPDFSDEVALAALRLKQQFSERSDAKLRIVTQFGFDPDKFINWAQFLRANDIDMPVHFGVAGPAKITTLIKYAAMCGVGNSINFLRKRASSLTALVTSHSPEAMVGPIEAHVLATPDTTIRAIHVFAFGGMNLTADWLRQRGSWQGSQPHMQIANEA